MLRSLSCESFFAPEGGKKRLTRDETCLASESPKKKKKCHFQPELQFKAGAKGATVMTSIATQDDAGSIATTPVESADIVILGAGYGGLHVAQRLTRLLGSKRKQDGTPWTMLIIDRQP